MSHGETPKKSCLARKSKTENPNDYCRCCKLSLKVQYGDSWKSLSSENLFKPSNKKGIEGVILSQVLEEAGIVAARNSSLSERLCKSCATKIRKTCEGFSFIVGTINVINPKFVTVNVHDELEVEVTEDLPRSKRALPTSVSTPERSRGVRKTLKVSSENLESISDNVVHRPRAGARKSLGMQFQENAAASEMIVENEDALLNIDDIMSREQTTRVKVLILWPNGRTEVRVPGEKEDILLLKNVALKNWQAVANSVLKHEQLKQFQGKFQII